MNILMLVLQIALAAVFAGAGAVKLIQPRERLAKTLGGWVYDVPSGLPKLLGLAEVLAAVGLIVPPLVHIVPILMPVAAVGLVILMVGALIVHGRRREYSNIVANVALAVVAIIVAWGRSGPYAF